MTTWTAYPDRRAIESQANDVPWIVSDGKVTFYADQNEAKWLRDTLNEAEKDKAGRDERCPVCNGDGGHWEGCRGQSAYDEALESLAVLKEALKQLLPFVLEDYYPNCATPEFKAAIEAAKKAVEEE